jgi:hypothetical protein
LWAIRILLVAAIIGDVITLRWLNLFTALLALFSTYLPYILSQKELIYIPSDMQIIMIIFAFASLYLGELQDYYYRFWWWDTMLHTFSGIILGLVGFILIYILNRDDHIDVVLSPIFIGLFTFTFAVSIGVFWEIFEFAMDSFLGMNMQKTGLVDTMWDLIADCIGGGIAAVYGYKHLKEDLTSYFEKLVNKFLPYSNFEL